MEPAELYAVACAACHGTDGGGIDPESPVYQSFETAPAEFTDALFNSREPGADWFLVIKYGGARLGLSSQMPAYGEALPDDKIEQLVDHLKQLVDTSRYPPGDLNFTRPIATKKAFPEDEAIIINSYERNEDGSDPFKTTLYYAHRFGTRHHGEVKLTHVADGERSELEELEIEWKTALAWSLEKQSILSGGLELAIPLEDDGSEALIPYLAWGKGLSDSLTFQTSLDFKLPLDDVDRGAARLRGILHLMTSQYPRSITPGLELVVAEPFESELDTEVTVIPQLFAGLSKGGHVVFTAGVELPLSDEEWDYRIRTFLLWDIADGPFWKGW
jgi:hypothetical protein